MDAKQILNEADALKLLQECEAKITKLETQLEKERNMKVTLEENLLTIRSRSAHINRMPHELLLIVFKELMDEDPLGFGSILLVCTKWNRIAKNSPTLWSTISFHLQPDPHVIKRGSDYAESAIKNSGNTPLSISIEFPLPGDFVYGLSSKLVNGHLQGSDLIGSETVEDAEEYRRQNVYDWLSDAFENANGTLTLYEDICDAILEYLITIAGIGGANMHRIRSLKLYFSLKEFSDWLYSAPFHYPTPLLEELVVEVEDDSDTIILPILTHPAPKISRISCNYDGLIDDLLDDLLVPEGQLRQLRLSFKNPPLDIFINSQLVENLRILCLVLSPNGFIPEDRRGLYLPRLEELTIHHSCPPKLISAPQLTTLRLFGVQDYTYYFSQVAHFPCLKKLHLEPHPEQMEAVERYVGQLPVITDVALVHWEREVVKDCLSRLKNNRACDRISIKGYRDVIMDYHWDFVPYEADPEKHEVRLND